MVLYPIRNITDAPYLCHVVDSKSNSNYGYSRCSGEIRRPKLSPYLNSSWLLSDLARHLLARKWILCLYLPRCLSVSHPFQRVDKQSAVKLLVLDSFWKCLSLSCHPFDLWIETFSSSTVCSSFLEVNHCNIKCMFWYLCVHYLCLWRLLIVRAELLIEPRLCINLEHSLSG